jgi:exosortase A-associated hydrolase 2
MQSSLTAPHTEALFLSAGEGQRFCLYHRASGPCRGGIVYLHPFADEMNKSRRMAALQARELAAHGYGVLQIDLHGCGDSSGDFGDATWASWLEDVGRARAWLADKLGQPVSLWGLRLGALLALDFGRRHPGQAASLLLWQPLPSGSTFLTQFLRLRMASQVLTEGAQGANIEATTALRASLRRGEMLEVAGYDLNPAMAEALDALDTSKLAVTDCPVHWVEIVNAAGRPAAPALSRIRSAWEQAGVALTMHEVTAAPFWASQEIVDCPALIAQTSRIFTGAGR